MNGLTLSMMNWGLHPIPPLPVECLPEPEPTKPPRRYTKPRIAVKRCQCGAMYQTRSKLCPECVKAKTKAYLRKYRENNPEVFARSSQKYRETKKMESPSKRWS